MLANNNIFITIKSRRKDPNYLNLVDAVNKAGRTFMLIELYKHAKDTTKSTIVQLVANSKKTSSIVALKNVEGVDTELLNKALTVPNEENDYINYFNTGKNETVIECRGDAFYAIMMAVAESKNVELMKSVASSFNDVKLDLYEEVIKENGTEHDLKQFEISARGKELHLDDMQTYTDHPFAYDDEPTKEMTK